MTREYIVQEIKRVSELLGGVAPGKKVFFSHTGIKESDWIGRFWTKWSDAIEEAGLTPQEMQKEYPAEYKVQKLIEVIRHYQKWPTSSELRMYARNHQGFPSHNTLNSLGNKAERIALVEDFCKIDPDCSDVLELIPKVQPVKVSSKVDSAKQKPVEGYVYLMKSGKYYKIGRSVHAEKRHYELSIQLPEKLTLIHKIPTDDPAGIEAYWHKRFSEKRMNGEWFSLSKNDVSAFKRRSYM